MKKMATVVLVPYAILLMVAFYLYFGPGLVGSYRSLEWKDIRMEVPSAFEHREYNSKGWEVYQLSYIFTRIRIAVKPAIDVSRLPKLSKKLKFEKHFPDSVYFGYFAHKNYDVVWAQTVGETTCFIKITTASLYAATKVMERLVGTGSFNETPFDFPKVDIPMGEYWTDLMYVGGLTFPVILILFIFWFAGKKPDQEHFDGDPIRLQEEYVMFTRSRKYQRKSSFCYLALTQTRFMVFIFKKPKIVIPLNERHEDLKIMFENKKVIIEKDNETFSFRPTQLQEWKAHLGGLR